MTLVSGGYKQIGKLAYVYMQITPNDSQSFWTNGGGGMLAYNFPTPSTSYINEKRWAPLKSIMQACVGANFYIQYDSASASSKGKLMYAGTKQQTPGTVIIKDVYLTD